MKRDDTPTEVAQRPKRGRPFGPGNRPKGGSKKGRRFVRACPLLRDLRHVMHRPASADDTPSRKLLREQLLGKPGWVFGMWAQLEGAHEAAVEALRWEVARAAH